ncbi:uncharacterized protein LTR77_003662 [Saxophila tyrrhenica]|uniref:Amidase domain-containing protein n=1 Tax=Saxophila tyrrhenica TaxID=1690608 RepID=A0AAV9PEM9_9PEZI|nr:hypothetical protein LTR77_003662 [Saxophila tyrrhenica]
MDGMGWRDSVRIKQQQLWSEVPPKWKVDDHLPAQDNVIDTVPAYLSTADREITEMPLGQLLDSLRSNEVTAQEALAAFAHRALVAHQFIGETANNIIGCTVNPYNGNLSAGGACGGEGALLALKGSPLGIGTDVAGSVRIPCSFNGLWSLKCSEGRLPRSGLATVLSGMPTASGSIGLISNDLGGVSRVFQALLSSEPWGLSDVDVLELPWRQEKLDAIRRRKSRNGSSGRLVFGVVECDAHVTPHPPVAKAIATTIQALERYGYEVIKWNPPPHAPAVNNLFQIFGSTSAREAREAINASGEPPIAQLKEWYEQGDVPPNSSADFWNLCDQRDRYRAQYSAYWASTGDKTLSGRVPDGIILPVAPTTAVRSGEFHYYGYSAIANVLDLPSGTIPVSGIHQLPDEPQDRGQFNRNELDARIQMSYRKEESYGMPVGIQVMCPRLQEEQVLGLMEAISEALADASGLASP